MVAQAVPYSSEFKRISEIPQREWTPENILWAIREMSSRLCFTGRETLLPGQAVGLYEAAHYRGLFGPLVVGSGKTGTSLLCPFVMNAKRPLILSTPAAIEGTKKAEKEWRKNWVVPAFIKMESYNVLSRFNNKDYLETYRPDLIVADECHKLRNRKASVSIQVRDYMRRNTNCMFVALSGTITKDSVKDYAHLMEWSSRFSGYMPLPRSYNELETFSGVLDVEKTFGKKKRPELGAFWHWISPDQPREDPYVMARKAYRKRLNSTPGVVRLGDSRDGVDASLLIRTDVLSDEPQEVINHVEELRRKWTRPDGWKLASAAQVWYVVRCMSLGFFLRLKTPPPKGYMDARADWALFVRELVSAGKAVSEGDAALHFSDSDEYQNWLAFKQIYKAETEAVWFSGHAIAHVLEWMRRKENWSYQAKQGITHTSIIWVEQPDFGRALSQISGQPFYYHSGKDERGNFIEDHDPKTGPAIASLKSCGTGLNLQHVFSQQYYCSMSGGLIVEQYLGRTHRRDQKADEVLAVLLLTCNESLRAYYKALEESRYEHQTVGNDFKVLYADSVIDAPWDRTNALWWTSDD